MFNKRRDIFRDGELVATVIVPRAIFDGSFIGKENWARRALIDYVSQFHGSQSNGQRDNWRVDSRTNPQNGRVTGIQTTIRNGKEEIFYMIVEPVKQPGRDSKYWIQIHKAVYNSQKEGDTVDEILYRMKTVPFSCGLFEAARVKKA